ncbi:MAG: hypothetical protein ACLP0J_17625 [Solirubrobacteraceae bacterium]
MIQNVPAVDSGRASYNTVDNLGEQMGVLDPIPDPAGGYVGVYHSPFGRRPGATARDFRISIAHSNDLIHWTRVQVLDPVGATMPTLRAIPGNKGYLLAYEKASAHDGDHIRVRYYRGLADVLANDVGAQVDLARLFSPNSNGTPSLTSISWHGSLEQSVIGIDFHYETVTRKGAGPDREAIGTLIGFRSWAATKDPNTDALLDSQRLTGNHGDSRQFRFANDLWRLYEGQERFDNFETWHVVLYDTETRTMHLLTMTTELGASETSFGNPVAQLEPAPDGSGQVLVVTMYIFNSASNSNESGELVYYQPTQSPYAPPYM